MNKSTEIWMPSYTLTPSIARHLMKIEAVRTAMAHRHLPPTIEAELRRQARLRSTHYSTRIEGNRLTLAETEQVIENRRIDFQGREQDVLEVRNYWNA
jgi:Fic family protein